MRASALGLGLLLLLVPASAAAQDLAARVTPNGLDTLTRVALGLIPPVFPMERLDPVLFDCPGSDTAAHIPATDVSVTFHALEIRTGTGAITVSTTLDIAAANTVQLDNVYACFGTTFCDVSMNLTRLGIVIELAAGSAPGGGVEFHGANVDLTLRPEDISVVSTGCAAGDAATWLLDAVKGWALDLVTPRLEAMIGERLGVAMTGVFSQTVAPSIDVAGFSITGSIGSLDLSSGGGIAVGGTADVMSTGVPLHDEPGPTTRAPVGDALPTDFEGDFQIAVSDRLVTDSLYEAWRGGLMRRLLADQSRSIELAGDGVAHMIGLEGGARLDITFDIDRPLVMTFGRTGPNVAEVAIEQLHITVVVTPPSGPASTIQLFASGSGQAAMTMSEEQGGMVLDMRDLRMTSVRVQTTNESLELTGARLSNFISGTVAPMLAQRLSGLPVAPGLLAIAGTFVYVRSIESEGGWQRLGADLYTADPSDTTPPDTTLTAPRAFMAAGTAAYEVAGTDNSTPVPLLRYRAWLDGTPLNEGAASSLRTVRFDVAGGTHILEVAAVDLNDLQDPTPVMHSFSVDGNPPTLTFTKSPLPIVSDANVTAAWMASDLEGPVESRWELRVIGDDGTATVSQETPFAAGTNMLAIPAGPLNSARLYELEVTVRDGAGNLVSKTFGFTVAEDGCSATASPRGAPANAFLAFAFFVFLLGRARRRQ